MKGGYVTPDCWGCGNHDTLSEGAFRGLGLWVSCPLCTTQMHAEMLDLNYGYRCPQCRAEIWLSDLLPHWEDLKRTTPG